MVTPLVQIYSGGIEKLKKTADEAKASYKGLYMGCKTDVLDAASFNSLTVQIASSKEEHRSSIYLWFWKASNII